MKNNKEQTIDYESSIRKSNELSMAKLNHGLTLNQMQLLAYAIYSTQKDSKRNIFNKASFEQKFGLGEYRTEHANEDTKKLYELGFATVNLEEDEFDYLRVFQRITYKKGIFSFKWADDMLPHILELKDNYVMTDLSIAAKFKSSFSWTLYEYLKAHYGYWHKELSKKSLMRLFGIENVKSYQSNTSLLKTKALNLAIDEINQYTEFEVWYKRNKIRTKDNGISNTLVYRKA
ncbi:replication initiation protein [Lentibacillus cibarius]|uniref:Replication initiation protein n=1 Tax=Lentibacillus cibarius TaxID=2583219 RepID=A0A5S3QHL6_9BACI|nr:replication initiation protein [Lentibacillus cibarius]TMN18838.1 replication initiation protein [Lentibacillus cibarius]